MQDVNLTGTFLSAKDTVLPHDRATLGQHHHGRQRRGPRGLRGRLHLQRVEGRRRAADQEPGVRLRPPGIRANAICPGFIDTPMFRAVVGQLPYDDAIHDQHKLALRPPEEIAGAACSWRRTTPRSSRAPASGRRRLHGRPHVRPRPARGRRLSARAAAPVDHLGSGRPDDHDDHDAHALPPGDDGRRRTPMSLFAPAPPPPRSRRRLRRVRGVGRSRRGLDAVPGAGGGADRDRRRVERDPRHADRVGQEPGRRRRPLSPRWPTAGAASTRRRSRRWCRRSSSTCARRSAPSTSGMMTGDAAVNGDAPIICCTAEILANLALRDGPRRRRRPGRDGRVPLLRRPRPGLGVAGAAARAARRPVPADVGDARRRHPLPDDLTAAHRPARPPSCARRRRPVPLRYEYRRDAAARDARGAARDRPGAGLRRPLHPGGGGRAGAGAR